VVDIMRQSTRDGELTVISDAVSCSEGFVHELEYGLTSMLGGVPPTRPWVAPA
jgi:hypothetical protein